MQRPHRNTLPAIVVLLSVAWASLAAHAQAPITAQTAAQQAAEVRILTILDTPYAGKFDKLPLSDVIAQIQRATGLPIYLDRKTLEAASIPIDTPITCALPPVSLHAALGLILKPLELVWTINNECVLVTNADTESLQLVTKVYPVLDLIDANPANPRAGNYQALIQLMTDVLVPTSWDEVGGLGAISQFTASGSLVISQSFANHQRIAQLLAALRTARGRQPPQAALRRPDPAALQALASITVQSDGDQAAEDRIRAMLAKPFSAKFHETPLAEILAGITRSTGLFIQIDIKALENAAIPPGKPVSCDLPEAPLRSALAAILEPLGLVWAVENECLLVTTAESGRELLVIKVYPVPDLILAAKPGDPRIRYQPLRKEIMEAIAPTTWDKTGGSGVISLFDPSQSLVISQTLQVHDEIELLLKKMRTAHAQ
jgi:hypothetical protein